MTDLALDSLTRGRSDKQILTDVYILLSDNARWCQEAVALTAGGQSVKAEDPRAAAWSVVGAIGFCSNELGIVPPHLLELLDQKVLEYTGYPGSPSIMNEYDLGWFNDYVTHGTVLEFLAGVIDGSEEEGCQSGGP